MNTSQREIEEEVRSDFNNCLLASPKGYELNPVNLAPKTLSP